MRLDCTHIAGGFILADAALEPKSEWFEPGYWREQGVGKPIGRGRGQAVSAGEEECWVLRHYHRGGFPGRFIADTYFWRGKAATRPARELRLLAALYERDAPVARPVASRVLRAGLLYRGDILTVRVNDARTLGDCARELGAEEWRSVGEAISRFHAAGGWHADLNAHNILVAPAGIFIVDLDRGRLVSPGASSQRRNLDRLERSLDKLGLLPEVKQGWQALLAAYRPWPTSVQ
ncbi:MAG: 3-deoxy-D-manno-octulosonic acid kinase [Gammaproteobacteria bacterium]